MGKRILIYDDVHKYRELENAVESVKDSANELIQIFESFQTWQKIETLQDFEKLVSDPVDIFDRLLIINSGIDLARTGGKKPKPEVVADLLDVDRPNFVALIKGEKITDTCKPCQKIKTIKTGSGVLGYISFDRYREFLLWDEVTNRFLINENLLSEKRESFQVYASTPEEIKIVEFWNQLAEMLNSLTEKNVCGVDLLDSFVLKLKNSPMFYDFNSRKLQIDPQRLYNEIAFKNSKELAQ